VRRARLPCACLLRGSATDGGHLGTVKLRQETRRTC
jgi:hypothetical protein